MDSSGRPNEFVIKFRRHTHTGRLNEPLIIYVKLGGVWMSRINTSFRERRRKNY